MSRLLLSPKYGVNPTIPVCFWCGNPRNEVVLMGRVGDPRIGEDKQMPMHAIIDFNPCDCCQSRMSRGITLIEATRIPNRVTSTALQKNVYPTGRYAVLKKSAALNLFCNLSDETRQVFVTPDLFAKIIS